jgi:hypothetical protein
MQQIGQRVLQFSESSVTREFIKTFSNQILAQTAHFNGQSLGQSVSQDSASQVLDTKAFIQPSR